MGVDSRSEAQVRAFDACEVPLHPPSVPPGSQGRGAFAWARGFRFVFDFALKKLSIYTLRHSFAHLKFRSSQSQLTSSSRFSSQREEEAAEGSATEAAGDGKEVSTKLLCFHSVSSWRCFFVCFKRSLLLGPLQLKAQNARFLRCRRPPLQPPLRRQLPPHRHRPRMPKRRRTRNSETKRDPLQKLRHQPRGAQPRELNVPKSQIG